MSTLRDISQLLARIEAPGAFATRRTTSADDLHLEVKGVGSGQTIIEGDQPDGFIELVPKVHATGKLDGIPGTERVPSQQRLSSGHDVVGQFDDEERGHVFLERRQGPITRGLRQRAFARPTRQADATSIGEYRLVATMSDDRRRRTSRCPSRGHTASRARWRRSTTSERILAILAHGIRQQAAASRSRSPIVRLLTLPNG
jgi:hypothetical protein